jgi:hypothetical protein
VLNQEKTLNVHQVHLMYIFFYSFTLPSVGSKPSMSLVHNPSAWQIGGLHSLLYQLAGSWHS